VLPCVFEVLSAETEEGGTFDDFVDPDIWADAGFQLSADAPDVLTQYINSLGSQKLVAKNIIALSYYAVAVFAYLGNRLYNSDMHLTVAKINIPSTGFATKPPQCTGLEPLTIDSVS
jgi:hypothetical protein